MQISPNDYGFTKADRLKWAPDVLDVVVATLANPLAGLGVAVKKIAEKAKEETGR